MFEATKSRIMAETQECVSRVYSAVRTRLSSLAHRVSSLETELRCKAQVVQVLESRIAELERRFVPQPDYAGDFRHAGPEEPGPPALVAIEGGQMVAPTLEEHVAVEPTPEDVGEAAPTPGRKTSVYNTIAGGPGVGSKRSPERKISLEQTSVNNPIAGGLGAGFKRSPERKISLEQASVKNSNASLGRQTLVHNSIVSLGQQTPINDSIASLGQQTPINNSIASLGQQTEQRAGYERSLEQTSSEPLSLEELSVLQQRLSSKFLAESQPTPAELPLNLSATPTRVIRRVQDEVEATEARIKNLGGPASQQQI